MVPLTHGFNHVLNKGPTGGHWGPSRAQKAAPTASRVTISNDAQPWFSSGFKLTPALSFFSIDSFVGAINVVTAHDVEMRVLDAALLVLWETLQVALT